MQDFIEVRIRVPKEDIVIEDVEVSEEYVRSAPFGMKGYTKEYDILGYEFNIPKLEYEIIDWDDALSDRWALNKFLTKVSRDE